MTTPRASLLALAVALGGLGHAALADAQDLPRTAPPREAPKPARPAPPAPKAPAAPKAPTPKAPAPAPGTAEEAPPEEAAEEAPPEEAGPEAAANPEENGDTVAEEAPAERPAAPPEASADAAPADAPATDAPTTEAPAAEAPTTEAPTTEAPAAEHAPTDPAAPAAGAPHASAPPAAGPPIFAYYPSAPSTDDRPDVLPYHEGDVLPEGYHLDTRIRRGLVIGGAVTFGITYLAAVGVAVQAHDDELEAPVDELFTKKSDANALFVPVVGPFIVAGRLGEERPGAAAVAVVDGLAQAAGLSMFIAGLAAPKTVLVKDDEHSLSVAPGTDGAASGLTVVGTF